MIPRPVARCTEAVADDQRESERQREAETRQSEDASAQLAQVELEPGEKKQEGEPDEREHADGLVEVSPAENLWPDDDPEQDLEHDRRQPDAGQRERERREHRDRSDNCNGGERCVQQRNDRRGGLRVTRLVLPAVAN
jgi:hypothetical protein